VQELLLVPSQVRPQQVRPLRRQMTTTRPPMPTLRLPERALRL
jgi:hypothetical protein